MFSLPVEIQAARLRLVKDRPYLAAAAWSLQPVPRPGLGTMAVDQWWRLYFDPAVTTKWTVEELSGVLYHEIMHLLRNHASRMKDYDPRLANIATDAEINDDLLWEGVELPGTPVTPAAIGQPANLLAEEYYAALVAQAQGSAPRQGAPAQPEKSGADRSQAGDSGQQGGGNGQEGAGAAQDTASASAPGGEAENGSDPSSTVRGGDPAGSVQPGDRGAASGSEAGDGGGSKPDSGGESISSSPSGQPSASSTQPEAASQLPAGPVGDRGAGGPDGRKFGGGAQIPAPGAGRCGSCATGHQEPWEDGPPGEGASSGVGRAEAELIRREVARQIQERSRARGDVPGHWVRWAEEKLRPKVDWRRELAAAVRRAVADAAGASDYSYRRPSRRQGQVGNGKVVLPALRHPVPQVAVVVDTSGSVSDGMLSQALAEISGVLKAAGQREGVHVLAVDTTVQACRRVFRPEQVHLAGGGGTDMGAGLEAVAKLRPRPQVVIVITDGHTPWPAQPPRGMRVVVALAEDGSAPDWAKTIVIGR